VYYYVYYYQYVLLDANALSTKFGIPTCAHVLVCACVHVNVCVESVCVICTKESVSFVNNLFHIKFVSVSKIGV